MHLAAVTLNADTKDVVFRNNIHEAAAQPIDPDAPIVTKAATGSKNDIYLENAADGTKATLAVNGSKTPLLKAVLQEMVKLQKMMQVL